MTQISKIIYKPDLSSTTSAIKVGHDMTVLGGKDREEASIYSISSFTLSERSSEAILYIRPDNSTAHTEHTHRTYGHCMWGKCTALETPSLY